MSEERRAEARGGASSLATGPRLEAIARVIERFGLESARPMLEAANALADPAAAINVAVFGQFKSGKSSMLNAMLGAPLLPTGAVPVTAVVTSIEAGERPSAVVRHLDGSSQPIDLGQIATFVTEECNPRNERQVKAVEVRTPAMSPLPGLRLIDTPGLGSSHEHNSAATREWLPNVAVALVAIGAERPMADDDATLIAELSQHVPRVEVVLTKIDLLAPADLAQVRGFVASELARLGQGAVPVHLFSSRMGPETHAATLFASVLGPISREHEQVRVASLAHKTESLARVAREYLRMALLMGEQHDARRAMIREIVDRESMAASLVRDELRLAAERVRSATRPAFEQWFEPGRSPLTEEIERSLASALRSWRGGLASQVAQCDAWLQARLVSDLTPLSRGADSVAGRLLVEAEERMRRVIDALRARLSDDIERIVGAPLPTIAWQPRRPAVAAPPVAISRLFATDWTQLSWILPMRVVGPLVHRAFRRRVPWEVEKNLVRLVGAWTEATAEAVSDVERQAAEAIAVELATLARLLGQRPDEAPAIREALRMLESAEVGP